MYDHGRLPTLTDAYRRLPTLIPGAGLCSFRIPQCDWAYILQEITEAVDITHKHKEPGVDFG